MICFGRRRMSLLTRLRYAASRQASAATINSKFYGCLSRKNKFPVGGVMVMLFVPLLVVVV